MIPEFDTPGKQTFEASKHNLEEFLLVLDCPNYYVQGHTRSWLGQEGLLCKNGDRLENFWTGCD